MSTTITPGGVSEHGNYEISTDILHSNDAQVVGTPGINAIVKRITLALPPATIKVQFKFNGTVGQSNCIVRDDGVNVGTQRNGSGSLDTWTEDVAVTSGELELYLSINAGHSGVVEDFRILGLMGNTVFTSNDP